MSIAPLVDHQFFRYVRTDIVLLLESIIQGAHLWRLSCGKVNTDPLI
jgi:hypothetical protein